ncbi:carbohydrate-binding protein [Streptomyces sp. enrichment culture]|uniref:carbohydrate-binding protein n=1 Tax=Streptomyces sp. enrichment culture TaxID=1795815 RepID=UPI003F542D9E
MTPGNNGASTPEDDDPFGYLYADGQANGAQPPSGGYGYPNSVSRVRTVGERQYGQQPGATYGQQIPQQAAYGQQQAAYGRPNPHYAAPETLPGGGAPTAPQQSYASGGGRGRGPNTKGLLIGALAVVAAVVIGIGVAIVSGEDDKGDKTQNQAGPAPTATESKDPSPTASSSAEEPMEAKEIDAKALRLSPGVGLATDVPGAQSDGGVYVTGLNQPGASVTWTVDGIPKEGVYTLFADYSTAGEDQSMTLTVNGKPFGTKLSMKNYAHAADGDFAKGWTYTYAYPTLTKGTNTLTVSCGDGDKCNVLLDRLRIKEGQVKE